MGQNSTHAALLQGAQSRFLPDPPRFIVAHTPPPFERAAFLAALQRLKLLAHANCAELLHVEEFTHEGVARVLTVHQHKGQPLSPALLKREFPHIMRQLLEALEEYGRVLGQHGAVSIQNVLVSDQLQVQLLPPFSMGVFTDQLSLALLLLHAIDPGIPLIRNNLVDQRAVQAVLSKSRGLHQQAESVIRKLLQQQPFHIVSQCLVDCRRRNVQRHGIALSLNKVEKAQAVGQARDSRRYCSVNGKGIRLTQASKDQPEGPVLTKSSAAPSHSLSYSINSSSRATPYLLAQSQMSVLRTPHITYQEKSYRPVSVSPDVLPKPNYLKKITPIQANVLPHEIRPAAVQVHHLRPCNGPWADSRSPVRKEQPLANSVASLGGADTAKLQCSIITAKKQPQQLLKQDSTCTFQLATFNACQAKEEKQQTAVKVNKLQQPTLRMGEDLQKRKEQFYEKFAEFKLEQEEEGRKQEQITPSQSRHVEERETAKKGAAAQEEVRLKQSVQSKGRQHVLNLTIGCDQSWFSSCLHSQSSNKHDSGKSWSRHAEQMAFDSVQQQSSAEELPRSKGTRQAANKYRRKQREKENRQKSPMRPKCGQFAAKKISLVNPQPLQSDSPELRSYCVTLSCLLKHPGAQTQQRAMGKKAKPSIRPAKRRQVLAAMQHDSTLKVTAGMQFIPTKLPATDSVTNVGLKPNKCQWLTESQYVEGAEYPCGVYIGWLLNGVRHGKGTFLFNDGASYNGEWVANRMSGRGVLSYSTGMVAYQGDFRDDCFSGHGTLYFKEPKTVAGKVDCRDLAEAMRYCQRYEGQFQGDERKGKGVLFFTNGELFEGEFEMDQAEGAGVFRAKDRVVKGRWRNGRLQHECR